MSAQITSYWQLVEPVWDEIDIGSPEEFTASSSAVSRPVLLLYAAHFCLSEIRNGGFLQFFFNSTGVLAPEAAAGFSEIGMTELASVVSKATDLLGSPYPRERDARWDALLVASGRSEEELEKIFKESPNLYISFSEAAEPLGFDALDRQVWALAETENGGFNVAATRYGQGLHLVQ